MSRKPVIDLSAWPSLSLEGNLIAPAMVAKIDQRTAPEQSEESYEIRKGLTARDEISAAFRVGQYHFDAFAQLERPSLDATRRFVKGFLKETFGFDDLLPADGVISFLAGGDRVPVLVVPPDEELEKRSATLSVDRSRSPVFALQDHLNDKDEALWGLVTNGMRLRLMRDNASLTRPAYIEADLAQMFTNEDIASFATLWLMIHRTRFGRGGTPATDCALERWRETGAREGEVSRNRLADQVKDALEVLGSGFLKANPEMAIKLREGKIPLTVWFNELLRLVYRLIFLMVAEDRNLLHPIQSRKEARSLYAQGYSLKALRAQCVRRSTWDRHYDRFEAVKIVFRSLTNGQEALALPALGGLFDEQNLQQLEHAKLENNAFMKALWHLSWLSDRSGMVPVNWREMETEELGSVYETLLELQPQIGDDGVSLVFASDMAEKKGNQRKTTGSYYTPDSLVQALLDTALDPVLDKVESEADDPAKALLKLSVIDPACGSGHFLLAAARRIATRLARIRADETPSLADFRHALRDVARSCIYGVDRNPMAVELTKVALWIETVDPGLPLGFFDAQIRCGDSLLGVFDLKALEDGIPDGAYEVLTGDDKDTAKYYKKANQGAKRGQGGFDFGTGQAVMPAMKPLALDFSGFRDLPENTLEEIGFKATRFEQLRMNQKYVRANAAADMYVAAFLLPKVGGVPMGSSAHTVPTTDDLWMALNQGVIRPAINDAPQAARSARAFHWPLEFPDVMQRGGFDVVLGNPPWEVIQLSEKEFFATLAPEIAALSGAKRKAEITRIEKKSPELFNAYIQGKRESEAANEFARASGRFPYSAEGKLNTYSLFAELFLTILGSGGGAGLIVPTGIATDKFNAKFFAHINSQKLVRSIYSFENEEFVFPAIHHSIRFCLLTMSRSSIVRADFAFFLRNIGQLDDPIRVYNLSPEEIQLINPLTSTAPIFRTRLDADITAAVYRRLPVLNESLLWEHWRVELIQNFFSTSNEADAEVILRAEDHTEQTGLVPVLRGTMIDQFNHGAASYSLTDEQFVEISPLDLPDNWADVKSDKYVPVHALDRKLSDLDWKNDWLAGWRDITSAHVNRTVIASIFPRTATDDTLSLILPKGGAEHAATLVANLNSMALDFIARQKVGGTHIRKYVISQFPILPPQFYTDARRAFITPKVLELTYTSHSLAPFARDLGYDGPPFAWDEKRRALFRADLDAFYARAYGLTRDELRYILDPADVKGEDYPSETFRVLKNKEMRQYGEYRTRRLVLEAWDRMEANGEFTEMEM